MCWREINLDQDKIGQIFITVYKPDVQFID
jgi:hypothetical protein